MVFSVCLFYPNLMFTSYAQRFKTFSSVIVRNKLVFFPGEKSKSLPEWVTFQARHYGGGSLPCPQT